LAWGACTTAYTRQSARQCRRHGRCGSCMCLARTFGIMSADVVFDNVAAPAPALTFYQTMLPSLTATVLVPIVIVCMAVCVVHVNCFAAAQWPDRLIALCFGIGGPYFLGVVRTVSHWHTEPGGRWLHRGTGDHPHRALCGLCSCCSLCRCIACCYSARTASERNRHDACVF
jgi:hypothetical protein